MPKLIFHPELSSEIKASYRWYQEKAVGLGDDFIAELEAAYEVIIELPDTWPKLKRDFADFSLPAFPTLLSISIPLKQFTSSLLCITAESQITGLVAYNQSAQSDAEKPRGWPQSCVPGMALN